MDKGGHGAPAFFQLLASVAEFGGGIGLALGLLTPLAAFGIACTMMVAIWNHITYGGSWELAAVYLAISIAVFVAGPGRYAVDRFWLGKTRPAP